MMERLLLQMQSMFDFIIVDAGQSTKDTSLKVTQMAEAMLLISTLNLPCLSNTSKLVQSYLNMGYASRDKIKIIINRYLKRGEISLKDAESSLQQELFWVVPNDYETTMSAINHGKSLIEHFPQSGHIQELPGDGDIHRRDGHRNKKVPQIFAILGGGITHDESTEKSGVGTTA